MTAATCRRAGMAARVAIALTRRRIALLWVLAACLAPLWLVAISVRVMSGRRILDPALLLLVLAHGGLFVFTLAGRIRSSRRYRGVTGWCAACEERGTTALREVHSIQGKPWNLLTRLTAGTTAAAAFALLFAANILSASWVSGAYVLGFIYLGHQLTGALRDANAAEQQALVTLTGRCASSAW